MNKPVLLLITAVSLWAYSAQSAPSDEWTFLQDAEGTLLSECVNSGTDSTNVFTAGGAGVLEADGRGYLASTPANVLWTGTELDADITDSSSLFMRYDLDYDLSSGTNDVGTSFGISFVDDVGKHVTGIAFVYEPVGSTNAPSGRVTSVAESLPLKGTLSAIAEVGNSSISVWFSTNGTDFVQGQTSVAVSIASISRLRVQATGTASGDANDFVAVENIRVASSFADISGRIQQSSDAKYLNEWLFDLDEAGRTLSESINSGSDGAAFSADTAGITQTDGRGGLICSNDVPGVGDSWTDGAVLSADVTNQTSGTRFLRYDFEYDLTAPANDSGTFLGLGFADAGGNHLSMVALKYSSDHSAPAPDVRETDVATDLPSAGNISVIAEVNLTNQTIRVWYDLSGTDNFSPTPDATGVISNLTSIEQLQFRATGDFIASSSNDCVRIDNIRTAASWPEITAPVESLTSTPELSVSITDDGGGSISVGKSTTVRVVITNSGGDADGVYATLQHDAGIGLSITGSSNVARPLAAGASITNTFEVTAEVAGQYNLVAKAFSAETESAPVSSPLAAQAIAHEVFSAKKGVGQASKSGERLQKERVEALNCSWYYAWNVSGRNPAMNPDIEFVPMKSGGNSLPENNTMTEDLAILFTPEWDGFAPVTHFLGFNEPEHQEQSNVTVEKALAVWPLLEEAAAANGITNIGSPSCSGANGNDGQWVTNFMAGVASNNLKVDFMAFHSYPTPTGFGMLNDAQTYYNRYGKDVWITEFNAADWQKTGNYTLAQTYTWMAELLYRLESTPYIKRYAIFPWDATWGGQADASHVFEVETTSVPGVTNQTSILTPLGKLYASYSSSDIDGPHPGVDYYIHNKANNERLNSAGILTATIYTEGETVDLQLISAGGDKYFIISADGKRLGNGDSGFYWTDKSTATGPYVQWEMTDAGNGWKYLKHAGFSKRLGTADDSALTLGSGTSSGDAYKWAFLRSYKEKEPEIIDKDVSTNAVTIFVLPGETASKDISLINHSTNSITYSINDGPSWVTYSSQNGLLEAQAANTITIQADAAGQSLGKIVFTNTITWGDGDSDDIVVTINVAAVASLAVAPGTVYFEGMDPLIGQTNLVIRNTGTVALMYQMENLSALTNGYDWTGTTYSWEAVPQQNGSMASFDAGTDSGVTSWIPLDFPFVFHGVGYTQMYVRVDGEIGLADGQIIGPYQGDLLFDSNSTIRWGGDANQMVVTWDSLAQKNGAADLTFQAILYRNGTIRFQYKELSDASQWPNTSIALESSGYKSEATLIWEPTMSDPGTTSYATNYIISTNWGTPVVTTNYNATTNWGIPVVTTSYNVITNIGTPVVTTNYNVTTNWGTPVVTTNYDVTTYTGTPVVTTSYNVTTNWGTLVVITNYNVTTNWGTPVVTTNYDVTTHTGTPVRVTNDTSVVTYWIGNTITQVTNGMTVVTNRVGNTMTLITNGVSSVETNWVGNAMTLVTNGPPTGVTNWVGNTMTFITNGVSSVETNRVGNAMTLVTNGPSTGVTSRVGNTMTFITNGVSSVETNWVGNTMTLVTNGPPIVVTNWVGNIETLTTNGTNIVLVYDETVQDEAILFSPAAPVIITGLPATGSLAPGESRSITLVGDTSALLAGAATAGETNTTFIFYSDPPMLVDLVSSDGEFDWIDTPGLWGVFQLRKRNADGNPVPPFSIKPGRVYTDGEISPEESFAPELGSGFLSKGRKWSWAPASRANQPWNTVYIRMPWGGEDKIDPDTRAEGFVKAEPVLSADVFFTANPAIAPANAQLDKDADGMPDLLERIAGTDENSVSSVFALKINKNTDGLRTLSWPAPNDTQNRVYIVEYTTSLTQLWIEISRQKNSTFYVDEDPVRNAAPSLFYRVKVLIQ